MCRARRLLWGLAGRRLDATQRGRLIISRAKVDDITRGVILAANVDAAIIGHALDGADDVAGRGFEANFLPDGRTHLTVISHKLWVLLLPLGNAATQVLQHGNRQLRAVGIKAFERERCRGLDGQFLAGQGDVDAHAHDHAG